MKHHHQYHHDHNQHPVNPPPPVAKVASKQAGVEFAPTANDVAIRAYAIYQNQGSRPGYELQHWLEAEAQLIAERNFKLDGNLPEISQK